jgi:hypothetical protein
MAGNADRLTPPLSHSKISLSAAWFVEGKNQKYSFWAALRSSVMERSPAYDSPMSKSTSGMPVPLTAKPTSLISELQIR